MPEYLAPGTYVDENHRTVRPIDPVGTSTAAFFGIAPMVDAPLREPVKVISFAAFRAEFVGTSDNSTHLVNAVAGFFENGGRVLYVVNLGPDTQEVTRDDLALLNDLDGISLIAAPGYTDHGSAQALMAHCAQHRYRFAVLDLIDTDSLSVLRDARPQSEHGGRAAAYAPWLRVTDQITGAPVTCPPSGHVCGIYAQTDLTRGVQKAPANAVVAGAIGLTLEINAFQQELLNPIGINCIRIFEARGIRVWGARTLSPDRDFDMYVNLRRVLSMIERSIELGTQWAQFETNDAALWTCLEQSVGSFLERLWQDNMLYGSRASDAYFVLCDRSTMTQTDIDNGRVIVLIGVALTRPAEFVILRIGQWTADATRAGG